jgi:hypothetical protein
MPVTNLVQGHLRAYAFGPDSSVILYRPGGDGRVYAEASLMWSLDIGRAYLWISGGIFFYGGVAYPATSTTWDPNDAYIANWFEDCRALRYTLRVEGSGGAHALVKLWVWD